MPIPISRATVFIVLVLLSASAFAQTPPPAPPGPAPAARPVKKISIPNATVHANVPYGPHERNVIDLYLPKDAKGPTPLIIWVHGGGWGSGTKDGGSPAMGRMVTKGYAVASVGYRLSGHAVFPAQMHDLKAAVRFLRANATKYNVDPERFAAWGSSAGGHLVALLGTSGDVKELEGEVGDHLGVSSRVQAVCDLFGPVALLKMQEQTPEANWSKPNNPESPESKLIGGPIQENKEKTEKTNPINYITKDDPPFLIVHGDQDERVPFEQSVMLDKALRKAGVSSKLLVAKGGTHKTKVITPENLHEMEVFFDEQLMKK